MLSKFVLISFNLGGRFRQIMDLLNCRIRGRESDEGVKYPCHIIGIVYTAVVGPDQF
jgi:hypothetical protein